MRRDPCLQAGRHVGRLAHHVLLDVLAIADQVHADLDIHVHHEGVGGVVHVIESDGR